MARCRCRDRETGEASGLDSHIHQQSHRVDLLEGKDRETEDATALLPPPQALPSYHPLHGAFSHPQQHGNGGFECPALWLQHKTCAFPTYSWPMHGLSWLALLAAQLQLEAKGPASPLGCPIDHQIKQQCGQLLAEASSATLFYRIREIICLWNSLQISSVSPKSCMTSFQSTSYPRFLAIWEMECCSPKSPCTQLQ